MEPQKNDTKSLFMLIGSMIVFGTIGIFRRYLPLSSGMIAFGRGLLGAGFLCAFVKIRGGKLRNGIGWKSLLWLIVSGVIMGFNWILLFEAYNYTTVSVATLCYYMEPTIVILLSPLLLKERLTVRRLICVGTAIVGMIFVSGVLENGGGEGRIEGVFLGLGAAALYSGVVLINKKLPPIDAYEKTAIQLASATVIMIPYLLFTEDFRAITMDLRTIIFLLIVGILHTGIAYAVYFGSMAGLRAQTVAIFSYIDPITALILSAVILHEAMSVLGIIGAVLILGAALVSEIERKK